ncbi:unnamed protein product [Adineta steineri]|uniref:Uncharacterized protein n=1 Tax=Adineta steineri TaxID=433720 RepID=A0A815MJT2_9BILA|nr:unnamed protein product [Adineta steineri]
MIIYCGANIAGTDGLHFALAYPSCHIYFLKPTLPFYEELIHSSRIRNLLTSDRSSLYHTFSQGQSLSFTDHAQSTSDKYYKLIARDIAEVVFEFKILKKMSSSIKNELNLLHLNCESHRSIEI